MGILRSETTNKQTKMSDAAKVPSVPATMLKRQQNIERVKTARQVAVVKRKKELKTKRTVIFKKAQVYAKEYHAKERDEIRLRRMNNGVFVKLNKSTLNMLRLVEPLLRGDTLTSK